MATHITFSIADFWDFAIKLINEKRCGVL